MQKGILDLINTTFKTKDRKSVIKELESITLQHVMAQSEYNLKNTRASVLYLAKGDLNDLIALTKAAKIDFRDVIMWATQDKQNEN